MFKQGYKVDAELAKKSLFIHMKGFFLLIQHRLFMVSGAIERFLSERGADSTLESVEMVILEIDEKTARAYLEAIDVDYKCRH